MALLGDMYSFGLLGAFTLTSIGIDRMRLQERKAGPALYLGLVTSLLVVTAWGVNLIVKTKATLFGGSVTLVGFAIALAVRRGLIGGVKAGFTEASRTSRDSSVSRLGRKGQRCMRMSVPLLFLS